MLNPSVQRTGASRWDHNEPVGTRRLAPTADAGRYPQVAMNSYTIFGVILGTIAGWLVCRFAGNRQLDVHLAAIKREIEFQMSLVKELQDRHASETGTYRWVLRLIEQGRLEQAKRLLAGRIAVYYDSWKGNTGQRLTSTIQHELTAIERDAESLPSIRGALQRHGEADQTNG
jgi:hypothetical protein